MSSPKALTVSIIIPAYNEQHYLHACLSAIAAQTVPPDEVIVVDNNSTDNTVAVAKKFSFVTLLHAKKQGVVFARNLGFNKSRSALIARIDADTLLPKNWVKSAKKIMKDESIAATTGPVAYFDMPSPKRNYWIDHQVRVRLYQKAPYAPFLFGSNMIIRHSVWDAVKAEVCERGVHEDLDLAIHVMRRNYDIHYSKTLLASTSSRRYDDSRKDFQHYMQIYRDTYAQHGITSRAPRIATTVYTVGYFVLRPIRPAYDVVTGKRQLRRLFTNKRSPARRHPF